MAKIPSELKLAPEFSWQKTSSVNQIQVFVDEQNFLVSFSTYNIPDWALFELTSDSVLEY